MFKLFSKRLFSRPKYKRTRPSQAHLALEALEGRLVPTVTLGNGILRITGTNADDVVTVATKATTAGTRIVVTDNGVQRSFSASQVSQIFFYGYDGSDRFENRTAVRSTAFGMIGNDTLVGGRGNDYLDGGDDEDNITGNAGNDFIIMGYIGNDDGHNIAHGGSGADTLFGADGTDDLFGDGGVDFMKGYGGEDFMDGGLGNDDMDGGAGSDTLVGGFGNDTLFGGTGRDFLEGNDGDDDLNGADDGQADSLEGGPGRDRFQVEGGYGGGWFPWQVYSNLDNPTDFNSAEDTFYGADLSYQEPIFYSLG